MGIVKYFLTSRQKLNGLVLTSEEKTGKQKDVIEIIQNRTQRNKKYKNLKEIGCRVRLSNLHLNEAPRGRKNAAEEISEEIIARIFLDVPVIPIHRFQNTNESRR